MFNIYSKEFDDKIKVFGIRLTGFIEEELAEKIIEETYAISGALTISPFEDPLHELMEFTHFHWQGGLEKLIEDKTEVGICARMLLSNETFEFLHAPEEKKYAYLVLYAAHSEEQYLQKLTHYFQEKLVGDKPQLHKDPNDPRINTYLDNVVEEYYLMLTNQL